MLMVAYVDVLSARTQKWKSVQFKHPKIAFTSLAIHVGLHIDYLKFMLPHFLDEFHKGNDVTIGHTHDYSASVIASVTYDCSQDTQMMEHSV
jgi:hypothetical protein